jgi:hypothetical protein
VNNDSLNVKPSKDAAHNAQTVTCTATIANLNPNLPSFQVTVSTTINVYQPAHTFTPTTPGALRIYVNDDGSTWFQAKGNQIPGIQYTGTITTPPIFVQGQNIGSWNYTQLVRPTDSYTANGTLHTDPNNAHKGLDGSFPYAGPYIADGSDGVSKDSPGKQVNTTMSRIDFKLEAWTWMLYTPPAHDSNSPTTQVAIHELDWTVKGYAIYDAVNLWQYDVAGNGFTLDVDRPTSVLPDWIELITTLVPY